MMTAHDKKIFLNGGPRRLHAFGAFLGFLFFIPVVSFVLPGVIYGRCVTLLALTGGTSARTRRVLGMIAVGGLGFFAAIWAFILLLWTQGMARHP